MESQSLNPVTLIRFRINRTYSSARFLKQKCQRRKTYISSGSKTVDCHPEISGIKRPDNSTWKRYFRARSRIDDSNISSECREGIGDIGPCCNYR